MRRVLSVMILCCGLCALSGPAEARTVRVATRVIEPFVMTQNGQLEGFSIELWRELARQMGVTTEFVTTPDVDALLGAVKKGTADLGIAAISITAERDVDFEFSQPMFEAGLQILTPVLSRHSDVVAAVIEGLFSSNMLSLLGVMALLVLVPAHLVWWWERQHPNSMLVNRDYWPGILEACWWASSTLATQADQMPRAVWARLVAVVWMFASVIFVAYFTASVTSSLTLQQLHGDISGPGDLPGKRVVTLAGSTSAEFLRQHQIPAREFESFEQAVAQVQEGEADAMVYDAPSLLYHAAHAGRGKVQVVGSVFRKENYGVVFRERTALLKEVDRALLKLREDGTYDLLYSRWFGNH